ncbi:MAG: SHOCT domain-containing protein [Opitutaceae bacterium]
MRVLSLTGKVPMFSTGYASATIIFKALNAGDPGLTSPLPSEAPAGAPGEKSLTSSTDDLYNALLKLDDLRKKGILTDEEFQAEKKKILSHSN